MSRITAILALLGTTALACSAAVTEPVSAFTPPAGGPKLTGEYLTAAPGTQQFSMLVRSNRRRAPLVVYLAGGPGASSIATAFLGSGPWSLTRPFAPGGGGRMQVKRNRWSWNRVANVVYLDQPRFSGYSTGSAPYVTSMSQASSDFVAWLEHFRARHPTLARRPLILAGESFAGQYVPAFAATIRALPARERPRLAGLLLASPQLRSGAYPLRLNLEYLCDRGLLGQAPCSAQPGTLGSDLATCVAAVARLTGRVPAQVSVNDADASTDPACARFVAETQPTNFPQRPYTVPDSPLFPGSLRGQQIAKPVDGAYFKAGGLVRAHVGHSPNPWDTRLPCRPSGGYPPWCYDDRRVEHFFNLPAVRRWVGAVRDSQRPWRFAQWPVALTFLNATPGPPATPSFEPFVAALRARLPVSFIVGDDDYSINTYAAQWYVNEIARSAYGADLFRSVPSAHRRVERGLLRYSQFRNAGHESIFAHPRAAYELFAALVRHAR